MHQYSIQYDIKQVFDFNWLNTVLLSWSASSPFCYCYQEISRLIHWIPLTFIFRCKADKKVKCHNTAFLEKAKFSIFETFYCINSKFQLFLEYHVQITITKLLSENKETITTWFFFFTYEVWVYCQFRSEENYSVLAFIIRLNFCFSNSFNSHAKIFICHCKDWGFFKFPFPYLDFILDTHKKKSGDLTLNPNR